MQSQNKRKGEGEAGVAGRNVFYPGAIPLTTKVTSILAPIYEGVLEKINYGWSFFMAADA